MTEQLIAGVIVLEDSPYEGGVVAPTNVEVPLPPYDEEFPLPPYDEDGPILEGPEGEEPGDDGPGSEVPGSEEPGDGPGGEQPETQSGVSVESLLDGNTASDVFQTSLISQIGDVVSNVSYTGSTEAAFFVDEALVPGELDLQGGFLLSTGGFPGPFNSSNSFTVAVGTEGDDDLDLTAQAAFSGAGSTRDASVLEFNVTVIDPDVDGIAFNVIFGSDEYPEYSGSSFVDIAAIYVNGVNVALFNDDPTTPLSVIDANLNTGNFIDNTGGEFAIEYDGFSNLLAVRSALVQGGNTIKIAIADTGDSAFDSGIYVDGIELLSEGGTGGGVLSVLNGTEGDDTLTATVNTDEINLLGGDDTVEGTPENLDGDIITGFGPGDTLKFLGIVFDPTALQVTLGSAILDIDLDGDGQFDTTVTLAGNFEGSVFSVANEDGNTLITVENPAPNAAPVAKDDSFTVDAGQTLSGNLLADNGSGVDSDPDGDLLTVIALGNQIAGLVVGPDGTFNYEAPEGFSGPVQFDYTLDDGRGGTDEGSVTINVQDVVPEPVPDRIKGTNQDDVLTGGAGSQIIAGRRGDDVISGLGGDDKLLGNGGVDTLFGGDGNDTLFGGRDADTLFGGNGDDVLSGDFGLDVLTGGAGVDTFAFNSRSAQERDIVTDFEAGESITFKKFASDAVFSVTQVGDDAVLSVSEGEGTRDLALFEGASAFDVRVAAGLDSFEMF